MRSIASLEKEIGFPLLGRTAQGIYLTREGQAVLPYLRRLIRDEDALLQYSAQIRGLTAGDIYIGSYFSVAANWLPQIIQAFQHAYPAVHVHIEECANKVDVRWIGRRALRLLYHDVAPFFRRLDSLM